MEHLVVVGFAELEDKGRHFLFGRIEGLWPCIINQIVFKSSKLPSFISLVHKISELI